MLNHKIIQRLMGELGLKSKIRWLCYRSYKLYLSPILDMFTGEIISYNISRNPNLEQIYDMLDKTFARFDSLILHSDEGWQYQHYGYRKRLEEHL